MTQKGRKASSELFRRAIRPQRRPKRSQRFVGASTEMRGFFASLRMTGIVVWVEKD
jgi:hypothetical protein